MTLDVATISESSALFLTNSCQTLEFDGIGRITFSQHLLLGDCLALLQARYKLFNWVSLNQVYDGKEFLPTVSKHQRWEQ